MVVLWQVTDRSYPLEWLEEEVWLRASLLLLLNAGCKVSARLLLTCYRLALCMSQLLLLGLIHGLVLVCRAHAELVAKDGIDGKGWLVLLLQYLTAALV